MRCGQHMLIGDQRSTADVEILFFLENIGLNRKIWNTGVNRKLQKIVNFKNTQPKPFSIQNIRFG